jgi:hypothetical protein
VTVKEGKWCVAECILDKGTTCSDSVSNCARLRNFGSQSTNCDHILDHILKVLPKLV